MELKTNEKIKIILGRKGMTVSDLAGKINTSRQNLTNKLSRNNFSEKELRTLAEAMNCDFELLFTMRETGEII